MNQLILVLICAFAFVTTSCKKKLEDWTCQCEDNAGAIIYDTTFLTNADEVYLFCNQKASLPNAVNCQSFQ